MPEENVQWRGISLIFVGLEELLGGRLKTARTTLLQALELCRCAGNVYGVIDTMLLLGRVAMEQGELRQAVQQYRHVKNIYAKLYVNSREEARQAARHLKLL